MKVLNLRCAHQHVFEGWFASVDDFQSQSDRGLVECPLCANASITRLPSAPRLNLSGAREPEPRPLAETSADGPAAQPSSPSPAPAAAMQARWLQAVQQVLRNTEDVGERFPEEARRIHYGETEHRGIRGQASPQERAARAEEGIDVMPLPMPAALKGTAH